jgi:predicted nucleic acid-binding protein
MIKGMAGVYLETSFVSALVTNRRDVASLYRREVSREWWATQANRHALFVGAEVLAELSHPSFPLSQAALAWIEAVPLLPVTDEALGLTRLLIRERAMPGPVAGDALHVAVATVHGMDYLLTWNVRHLANPNKLNHLRVVCLRAGLAPPRILTPELLWEPADE